MSGVLIASKLIEWNPTGSSWVNITSKVLSVDGGAALSGGDTPLAFGSAAESRATLKVLDTLSGAWERTPIRISFSIDSGSGPVTAYAFVGLVAERTRSGDGSVELRCEGASAFVRPTTAYSGLFVLRALFTKTTASSIEDPTNGSYAAGVGNYGLWQAGGRPYEQAGSYPSAAFYYSCSQAVIAPPYSWLAGEDGWVELQKLAQAAAGQLFTDTRGVMVYKNPFDIVANSPVYTFDESVYDKGSFSERTTTGETGAKWICSFTPRAARPLQQISDDTQARLIQIGESITVTLEPQWPLQSLETASGLTSLADAPTITDLLTSALIVTDLSAAPIDQGGSGYTHSMDAAAQHLALTITNASGKPIEAWRIVLRGEPISAGETQNVSVGSGTIERQIEDSPYIQTKGDATRRAHLYSLFYGTSRAERKCTAPYDPDRAVGEVVNVSNTRLSVSGAHVIVGIDHSDTGATAAYTFAPVSDLPAASNFWRVSTSAQTGTLKIGF